MGTRNGAAPCVFVDLIGGGLAGGFARLSTPHPRQSHLHICSANPSTYIRLPSSLRDSTQLVRSSSLPSVLFCPFLVCSRYPAP
ncbi:hypothetical protein L227DRAFT_577957 [Lentinus tigrinus ALCF2SS1-6]|uniref:Uncharacterized protein n=1 Tax=Lentinus tigrinus ALCF2SS1-6 TaxID=1328759 RepID=A0A5C2S1M7_9APHY|nr:hypothetical protein L227DRAFT_577957 [Lentinus tigrinus ALCF2SS1-6]